MNIKVPIPPGVNPEALAKRAMYLAWLASSCGGKGWLQDRGQQSENEVWKAMFNKDDYDGAFNDNKPGKVYADYVRGRMMKLGIEWNAGEIGTHNDSWRSDYQSFCRKHPDFGSLIAAAIESLRDRNPKSYQGVSNGLHSKLGTDSQRA